MQGDSNKKDAFLKATHATSYIIHQKIGKKKHNSESKWLK